MINTMDVPSVDGFVKKIVANGEQYNSIAQQKWQTHYTGDNFCSLAPCCKQRIRLLLPALPCIKNWNRIYFIKFA